MKRNLVTLFVMIFVAGCSSTKSASYHYAQKQIEHGDLNFENRLRVDEYVNAFSQGDLAKPKPGEDLAVKVDYFSDTLPKRKGTTLAQIAVRTRDASASEKSKRFGITLVLDNSGSMADDGKFQDAISAALAMVSELNEGTEFAMVVFSSSARVVLNPTVVTAKSRETIKEEIKKLQVEGGTNIEAGLILGYKTMAQLSKGTQSRLLLLTDGISNVGVTDPKELAKKAGVEYLEGARISTVGLGHDVDEGLLRTIAEKGRGAYYFAENASALKSLFRKDIESLMIPIAKDVKVTIKGGSDSVIKKVYGYDQPLTDNSMTIDVGELNSDDWRIFVVEIEGKDKSVSVESLVSYHPVSGKPAVTKMAAKKIVVGGSKKSQINKVVARNAVVFANALTLIEVSKLDKALKFKEAEDIVTIQLANLEVARSFDPSSELSKEVDCLNRVKLVLQERQSRGRGDRPVDAPVASAGGASLKSLVRGALGIAEKAVPGPWSLVIGLIGLVLE